jgi:hypothetical protein
MRIRIKKYLDYEKKSDKLEVSYVGGATVLETSNIIECISAEIDSLDYGEYTAEFNPTTLDLKIIKSKIEV